MRPPGMASGWVPVSALTEIHGCAGWQPQSLPPRTFPVRSSAWPIGYPRAAVPRPLGPPFRARAVRDALGLVRLHDDSSAVRVLAKPFDRTALLAAVAEVVRGRQLPVER